MKELHIWRTTEEKHELFTGSEEEFLAIEDFYCKEWELNGELHREDGPAAIYSDGAEYWYQNGERHREDGPAVSCPNGYKEWWKNGLLHRDDGPAIERNGMGDWYIHGELIERPVTIYKIKYDTLKSKVDSIIAILDK